MVATVQMNEVEHQTPRPLVGIIQQRTAGGRQSAHDETGVAMDFRDCRRDLAANVKWWAARGIAQHPGPAVAVAFEQAMREAEIRGNVRL